MSRPTDTERGARMARDFSLDQYIQQQLFAQDLDPEFWRRVQQAAEEQLEECRAMREARG